MDSKRFIKTKIKREVSTKHQTISENSFQHILGAVGFSGMLHPFYNCVDIETYST